jgi:hypothetical protein
MMGYCGHDVGVLKKTKPKKSDEKETLKKRKKKLFWNTV